MTEECDFFINKLNSLFPGESEYMKDAHLLSSSLFFRDESLATMMWPFSFLSGVTRNHRSKRLGVRLFNLTLTRD